MSDSTKKIEYHEYEEMYKKFLNYETTSHEKNQKRIRVGIKVNIFLPLVFLIISFITSGSKLVFLVLWILSLFGIAFYLIYVEYNDFKLKEKLKEFGIETEKSEKEAALIGQEIINRAEVVEERIDEIDEILDENRHKIAERIEEIREERKDGLDPILGIAKEKVAEKLEAIAVDLKAETEPVHGVDESDEAVTDMENVMSEETDEEINRTITLDEALGIITDKEDEGNE